MIRAYERKETRGLPIDPRTRLFIAPVIGFCAFALQEPLSFYLLVALAGFLLILSGQLRSVFRFGVLFGALALLEWLVGFSSNFSILMAVNIVAYVIQRIGVIAMAGKFISANVTVSDLIVALEQLHIPKQAVIPLTVALRFAPTIKEEYRYLKDSMKIRGISISASGFLLHPAVTIEHAMIPLLMRSLKISDELAASAMVRGIDNTKKKTALRTLKMHATDWALMLLTVGTVAALFFI